jgi:uroporphyrinogen III methyltransferase/synthase
MHGGVGKVSFIGAGPGDPRLLTLRGAELLARADVVVFDEDVHEAALDLAPETAKRVRVPRGAEPASNVPDLVTRARSGAHVVRLFYGDPFAFRGGAIELAGVRQAHVEVEVVAGVIAPTAAAAYSGLALSRYEDVTPSVALAVVNEAEELHDWRKLSLATDTLALLTDAEQLLEITHTLTYYGRKPETPAALVRNVSLPSQKVVLDTLVGIRKHIAEFEPGQSQFGDDKSMVLLVVGDSIAGREALRWFDTRPLSGKRILVTRAAAQGRTLGGMLRERGAEPVHVPLIEIRPPEDRVAAERAARELASYAWVCFTSENGVAHLWSFLKAANLDARAFGTARIAAVGPGTAAALEEHGLRADVVAKDSRGEGVAKAILDASTERGRVLVPRAKEARDVVETTLRAAGFEVDVVAVYETHPAPREKTERLRTMLESRTLEAITFTSASTVHALCDAIGPDAPAVVAKSGARVVTIGPVTSEAAAAREIKVDATASVFSLEGLVAALEGAFTRA